MRDLTRTGRHINSLIGKAVADHNMIEEGDRILVGVSGGKDSLTLMTLLKAIQGWAPVRFSLKAAHVRTDLACGGSREEEIGRILDELEVECHYTDTVKVTDDKGETSCFWCSWNRRKALFRLADAADCNKVALGHHKDDIAETMLLNLLYNGEISAMNPLQEMFKGKLHIIRPLCYVEEKRIRAFAGENGFPPDPGLCPFGEDSKRSFVKKMIREAEKSVPGVNIRTNIFRSLARIKPEYTRVDKISRDDDK
ncbi:MAG: tRNA 2-thiocytidine(32) synthetase TtcA [Candidatus Omnitrophica bacterium]|nr:tRNA 2-thiocytidine(32) synthetase TtcA [Candidatus Omnitrophota bacterium]